VGSPCGITVGAPPMPWKDALGESGSDGISKGNGMACACWSVCWPVCWPGIVSAYIWATPSGCDVHASAGRLLGTGVCDRMHGSKGSRVGSLNGAKYRFGAYGEGMNRPGVEAKYGRGTWSKYAPGAAGASYGLDVGGRGGTPPMGIGNGTKGLTWR
jgi:hypothetical protein